MIFFGVWYLYSVPWSVVLSSVLWFLIAATPRSGSIVTLHILIRYTRRLHIACRSESLSQLESSRTCEGIGQTQDVVEEKEDRNLKTQAVWG
jgi:hypothetical protein